MSSDNLISLLYGAHQQPNLQYAENSHHTVVNVNNMFNINSLNVTTSSPATNVTQELFEWFCNTYVQYYICLPKDPDRKSWVLGTEVILHSIIVIFGLIGNILSLIVLNKDSSSSSTNTILKALATWDIINLTLATLNNVFRYYIEFYMESENYNADTAETFAYMLIHFIIPMNLSATYGSFVMTVMVTVDRYIAVCKPMVIRRRKQVYIVIALLSLYVMIFHIPVYFEYKVNTYAGISIQTFPEAKPVKRINENDQLWANQPYQLLYRIVLATLLRDFVPIILLIIFNVRLYIALKAMRDRYLNMRRGSNRLETRRHASSSESLTRTVVVVVTVFLIITLPNIIYELINRTKQIATQININGGPKINADIQESLHSVQYNIYFITSAKLLTSVASSVNFVIYILFARKFKKIFIATFCKFSCLKGRFDDTTMSNSSNPGLTSGGTHMAGAAAQVLPINIATVDSMNDLNCDIDTNEGSSNENNQDVEETPKKTVTYDNNNLITEYP